VAVAHHARWRTGHASAREEHAPASEIYSQARVEHAPARARLMEEFLVAA
jgi:hypothetical protein